MKSEFVAGTYTTERDFLVAGSRRYRIVIDVDELAGTDYQLDVWSRETETDSWGDDDKPLIGMGATAADANGILEFDCLRYLRLRMIVTGGDVPNGVIGYAV